MDAKWLNIRANSASGVALAALGGVALLGALYHGSVAAAALAAVLVGLPALAGLTLRHAAARLAVSRKAPDAAFEGDTVEVRILIENRSRFSVFYPLVVEVFPPEIHARKEVVFPERIPPGGTARRSYRAECILSRGVYEIGPTYLVVSDPFGWFQVRRRLEYTRAFKVYPRFHDFGLAERTGLSLSDRERQRAARRLGESREYFSVREYRRGDSLRKVHWRLTAHRGYPVVREYLEQSSGDLALFIDTCRAGLVGVGRSSSLELAIKLAGALASSALRRGQRVQVVAGAEPERVLPPRTGRAQLQHFLDLAIELRPDGETPLDDLLERYAALLEPGATVVLPLAPYLQGSERMRSILARLRARGMRVIAAVLDGGTFRNLWEIPSRGTDAFECAETLRAQGIEAHVVPCAADLRALFAGAGARGADQ